MARVTQVGKIALSDDGTLDTVVRCTECGREFRGNFEPGPEFPAEDAAEDAYDTYVEEFLTEVSDEHECDKDDE